MSDEDPILELENVRAGYGPIEVLRGVNLAVRPGRVLAILGPNGGGKSTTLRVCAGLMEPTSGEYRLAGRIVNGIAADQLARRGLCTIPEGKGIFPNLTVRENLLMMTHAGSNLSGIQEIAFDRFPQLGERRNQLAGTMSGGEQQMLAMARALSNDPAVLLIDELSMGLAPLIVRELYDIVAQIAADGIAVMVAEQFARVALDVADEAALMLHGQIARTGEPAQLERELEAVYLGATT